MRRNCVTFFLGCLLLLSVLPMSLLDPFDWCDEYTGSAYALTFPTEISPMAFRVVDGRWGVLVWGSALNADFELIDPDGISLGIQHQDELLYHTAKWLPTKLGTHTLYCSSPGYSFAVNPQLIEVSSLTNALYGGDWVAGVPLLTISGTVTNNGQPMAGVKVLSPFGNVGLSQIDGSYSVYVHNNWTGSIYATAPGYTFTPASYDFSNLTTDATGKDFATQAATFTVSGVITSPTGAPLAGVVVSFTGEGTTTSDANGNFSKTVPNGWSGLVMCSKSGYLFNPASRSYTNLSASVSNANFTGYKLYTVSGYATIYKAGVRNVIITAYYNRPVGKTVTVSTDANGYYSFQAPETAAGYISAALSGYGVTPARIDYQSIKYNLEEQNFTLTTTYPVIAGRIQINNTGLGGVKLSFTDAAGVVKETTSSRDGYYCMVFLQTSLTAGWSGTTIPSLTNFTFSPTQKTYTEVRTHLINENYKAISRYPTLSGRITLEQCGVKNVQLIAGSSSVSEPTLVAYTDAAGYYNICLTNSIWSGMLTPFFRDPAGQSVRFQPLSYSFSNITTSQYNRNFTINTGSGIVYISGRVAFADGTAAADVILKFSNIGAAISDALGSYAQLVPRGWTGSVTPVRTGLTFQPALRSYTSVTLPKIAQNYIAAVVQPLVSGRIANAKGTGIAEVVITFAGSGVPSATVKTDVQGFYSIRLTTGWSGVATPAKSGYFFTPATRTYSMLSSDQLEQNYSAVSVSEMNTFTGTGYWTDIARWSQSRVPIAGEPVRIAGNCTMNASMPLLSVLFIDAGGIAVNIQPTLKMSKVLIPKIPLIINNGAIYSSYLGEPWPAGLTMNGLAVLDYNSQDPPASSPAQYLPAGIYKEILLTGNKYVYLRSGIARAEKVTLELGARFKVLQGSFELTMGESITTGKSALPEIEKPVLSKVQNQSQD